MERIPVTSSNVVSIGYDPTTQTMEVEFKGGSIYHYFEVPEEVFRDVVGASSVGGALNSAVKGVYRYQRIA